MEYKILREPKKEILEIVVTELIKKGWKPLGGSTFSPANPHGSPHSDCYFQTMIRDDIGG